MAVFLVAVVVVVCGSLVAWLGGSLRAARTECERMRERCDGLAARLDGIVDLEAEKRKLQTETEQLAAQQAKLHAERDALQAGLREVEEEAALQSCGVYAVASAVAGPALEVDALRQVREQQRALVRDGEATRGRSHWWSFLAPNKLEVAGAKLLLRVVNSECQALLAALRGGESSGEKAAERLEHLFEVVHGLTLPFQVELLPAYMELKRKEVALVAQAAAAQRGAVEPPVERTGPGRLVGRRAEQQALIQQLEASLSDATEEGRLALEEELAEATHMLAATQRAADIAELEGAGYVYVLSNLGAFGSNVYAIGVTRYEDPFVRVDELNGEAVPFGFDVHAMVFSTDAAALRDVLRRDLQRYRVNRVDSEKDFFRVDLAHIASVIQRVHGAFDLSREADAEEFRASTEHRAGRVRAAG